MDIEKIVRRSAEGVYIIEMPKRVTYSFLVGMRQHIGYQAAKHHDNFIGVIYIYPDESGQLVMPEFSEDGERAFDILINPTRNIRFDFVVYVNISNESGMVRGGMRLFYLLIHRLFPMFGKEADFADSLEEALEMMKVWREVRAIG